MRRCVHSSGRGTNDRQGEGKVAPAGRGDYIWGDGRGDGRSPRAERARNRRLHSFVDPDGIHVSRTLRIANGLGENTARLPAARVKPRFEARVAPRLSPRRYRGRDAARSAIVVSVAQASSWEGPPSAARAEAPSWRGTTWSSPGDQVRGFVPDDRLPANLDEHANWRLVARLGLSSSPQAATRGARTRR